MTFLARGRGDEPWYVLYSVTPLEAVEVVTSKRHQIACVAWLTFAGYETDRFPRWTQEIKQPCKSQFSCSIQLFKALVKTLVKTLFNWPSEAFVIRRGYS